MMRERLKRWSLLVAIAAPLIIGTTAVAWVGFRTSTGLDFFVLLVGVGGILTSALTILIGTSRGKKSLRDSLGRILNDKTIFSSILSERRDLHEHLTNLVATYHGRYGPPDDIKREVTKEIVDRLSRPLRANYKVLIDLSEDKRGFSVIEREIEYEQFSYDEPDSFVFGSRELFKANIELTDAMRSAGVALEEVFSFSQLQIDGVSLQPGIDYEITEEEVDGILKLCVACDRRFPTGQDKIHIAFKTRSMNRLSDYNVSTMMCVVRSLLVTVTFDPERFDTMLFGMVPVDWNEPRTGRLIGEKMRLLEFQNRVLLPGHSALTTWRFKANKS